MDFLRRVTAPDAGARTYSEARQFLSNAGRRLTPQEQKLAAQAQRYLSQFASSLNDAIRDTAENAGVLDDYTSAVDEYRQAMKLNDLWEATKEQACASSSTPSPVPQRPTRLRAQTVDDSARRKHVPPKSSEPVSRSHSQKLDAQLASLDRSHTNRQNALAASGAFTSTSPMFKRSAVPKLTPPKTRKG